MIFVGRLVGFQLKLCVRILMGWFVRFVMAKGMWFHVSSNLWINSVGCGVFFNWDYYSLCGAECVNVEFSEDVG